MKIKGGVVLLFAAILSSCVHPDISRRLDAAESVLEERPDSALAIIRSIDTLSLHTQAIRARYSLLHAIALDKNYIDTTDVGLLSPAVNYFDKHGTPDDQFKVYYYQGRIQYNAGDYNAAAIAYTLAERLTDEVTDTRAKGLLYMAMADVYNKAKNRAKEEEYVKKGIAAFEEARDVRHGNLSAGRLAILYYGKQEWDMADSLFKVGIEQATADTVAMSVFLSNYARMKVIRPDPDPSGAIGLLKELSMSYKRPLSLTDYGVWAYAAALTGDIQTCSRIESQLIKLDEPHRNTILYWLYRIEQYRGNYEKAIAYNVEANAYNWKLTESLLSDSVGQALQSHYLVEANGAKREAHILKLRLLLVTLGLCLIFLLVFGFLRYKRDRREKEIDRLLRIREETNRILKQTNEDLRCQNGRIEEEKRGLQEQMDLLKHDSGELEKTLENLRKDYVSTYKEKFSAIGELCNAYMNSKKRTDKNEFIVRRVERLIAFISEDDGLHAHFEGQINRDLNDIVKHLKEDLGSVDKKESRFVCYCIAGFEPEMIASILGLSISNVYTKKSRLKDRIRKLDSPYKDEYLRML